MKIFKKSIIAVVTVLFIVLCINSSVFAQCGPGSHWVDVCAAGIDSMSSTTAVIGIDVTLDCIVDVTATLNGPTIVSRSDPRDDSQNYPGTRPVDGHLDVIDTEIISMSLTGDGLTLTVGAGQGQGGVLGPSYGTIAEDPSDNFHADSFFDIYFELSDGLYYHYNHDPLRISATIDSVPPYGVTYTTPTVCLPLYTSPFGGTHTLNLITAEYTIISQLETIIQPGYDLFVTPPDQDTWVYFGSTECPPIPQDFFGPGSDPFTGTVVLQGTPLETSPPDTLGETDLIIRRNEPADVPLCGSADTVEIELIALSLKSVAPITVTYNGGMTTELWDVNICLSSTASQQPGTMSISRDCDDGGTFSAILPVIPKIIFTQIDPPYNQWFIDYGSIPQSIMFQTTSGHWLFADPGFNVLTSPGGVAVDHDCDGTINVPVGQGSNFYSGLTAIPCTCFSQPTGYDILMTYWYSSCMGYGCLPPTEISSEYDVLPGYDLCTTPAGNTSIDFNTQTCDPIPAGFFGPGSDPFDGVIALEGEPLETSPEDTISPADRIVERLDTAYLPVCGDFDVVEIEIVALSLKSVAPITVTYWGGIDPELWDLRMCLSSVAPQPTGTMTITRGCEDGGTYTSVLPVIPKLIFTKLDPPYTQCIMDYGGDPRIITLMTELGHWMYYDPGFNVIKSPGGFSVDHDCNGSIDVAVGPGSNFYSGLYPLPCNCFEPSVAFDIFMTYWYSECMTHSCLPPIREVHGYEYLPGDIGMYYPVWPPQVQGGDVTYYVNFMRQFTSSIPCLLDGFWCSADVNGSCAVDGADLSTLVSVMRNILDPMYCNQYPTVWPTPLDLPPTAPPGWPNCETFEINSNSHIIPIEPGK